MLLHSILRRPSRLSICCLIFFLVTHSLTQSTYVVGTFSGAIYVTGTSLTSAAQVQCPAGYPNSCSSIEEPDYCCPSNSYCARTTDQQVGCCPIGTTCSGSIGNSGGYETSTVYPSSTTYQQTITTTYVTGGGGVVVPAGYTSVNSEQYYTTTTTTPYTQYVQTTQAYAEGGQYCSTLTEIGPHLPTTAQGDCGTILVVAPGEGVQLAMGWTRLLGLVLGLHVFGSALFRWRI